MYLNNGTIFIDDQSSVRFYLSLLIDTNEGSIEILGEINGFKNPDSTLYLYTSKIILKPTGKIIDIENIGIYSSNIFDIKGLVSSSKKTCTYEQTSKSLFNFLLYSPENSSDFKINFIANESLKIIEKSSIFDCFSILIPSNYTVLLLTQKSIDLSENASLKGARIGIFSSNLSIDSKSNISSTGFGCSSDSGPGKGQSILHEDNYCGGMGGSHGGYKGFGLGVNKTKQLDLKESILCRSYAIQIDLKEDNLPYGEMNNPIYEGSGGGSGVDDIIDSSNNRGGSGGGVIFIGVYNSITNYGVIESNGQSVDYILNNNEGPGAGSGGSIQIHLLILLGNGSITCNGGSSSQFSGEGGGGRIKFYFLKWNDPNIMINTNWNGNISTNPGTRYVNKSFMEEQNLDFELFRGKQGSLKIKKKFNFFFF